jgi:hypothetical protein
MSIENLTKQTKQIKQNVTKTKQNKTKQNKIKTKTKQNKNHIYNKRFLTPFPECSGYPGSGWFYPPTVHSSIRCIPMK